MKNKIFLLLIGLFLNAPLMASAPAKEGVLLFLGDSLTEGYGVALEKAYPALLELKFHKDGHKNLKIINAGIGGSTTAGATQRLKWHLRNKIRWLFLCLGANDGLRGVNLQQSEANLRSVIEEAQKNKIQVILAGMMLPYNYGEAYRKDFEKMYERLARDYKTPYFPFLLKDVAAQAALNQDDGIHPNEKGHEVMAKNLYPFLLKVL